MAELSDAELLAELGVSTEKKKAATHTAEEARVIAGFEEIIRFVDEHNRAPAHGDDNDIFERLYAVRLDQIRAQPRFHPLLADIDRHGLLTTASGFAEEPQATLDDDALLSELGVAVGAGNDITQLRHVRSTAEKRAAEEIANREPCEDFDQFKLMFDAVRQDLSDGTRKTKRFEKDASISAGEYFIVGGQIAYVAVVGEEFVSDYGRRDARLRVIYDNATESDILLRSLQRALHKDEAGRRISDPSAGPLFADEFDDGDVQSGTIYVLRSLSDQPEVADRRELIHKIGVTVGEVEDRIAGAASQATYLFADVEVVAEYKLAKINRSKLEALLHRVFAPARLKLEIPDRFGKPLQPREWFLVPLPVIDEAVERIRDGSITAHIYDPTTASLVETSDAA